MAVAYLGLGSNLGDREGLLRGALAALQVHVALLRVSSAYDTAPQLVMDQPRFLNAAVCGITGLSPLDLLRAVKALETELGRTSGTRFGPRAIDIDVGLYDALTLVTDELTLPHPRLPNRAFAMVPLAEIAPELPFPGTGRTLGMMAVEMAHIGDVRLVGTLV